MKTVFKRLSTFWQMSIITFFIMIGIFISTYLAQFFLVKAWIFDQEKDNVRAIYDQIAIFFDIDNIDYVSYLRTFDLMDLDLVIYNENKEIIFITDNVPELIYKTDAPSEVFIESKSVDSDGKIILHGPIYLRGDKNYIYMEKEIEIYEDFVDNIVPIMLTCVLIIVLLSLGAGIYISRKFLNKLKTLKSTMENVKDGGVSNRVDIINPRDEFDEIGIVFNSMMDEVEKSFNLQKQFVQDASHELRTPLTILKGHLRMLNRWGKDDKETLDKSLNIALEEVERLIKLVNDLLCLTKMENEVKENLIQESVDINGVIDEVLYGFDMLKHDAQFEFNRDGEIYFKISKEHLKQLIIIFIDNAIKYCDKDPKIIKIKTYEDESQVYISIKDNGIGIKEDDLDKVFDKFYRADKARKYNNSFGIGLSIASQIVRLYKGKVEINSEFGVSTEVIVSFEK